MLVGIIKPARWLSAHGKHANLLVRWPTDELFLVTHRALRDVPRVRVVWDLLVERVGRRAPLR